MPYTTLPYTTQSPTLYREVEYNEEEIRNEIHRILDETDEVGQSLYHLLPLFCNPTWVIPEWCWQMIEDYHYCTNYNLPIARDLDSASAWVLDCFGVIGLELNKMKEKDGR